MEQEVLQIRMRVLELAANMQDSQSQKGIFNNFNFLIATLDGSMQEKVLADRAAALKGKAEQEAKMPADQPKAKQVKQPAE